MKIQESAENYLEAILVLTQKNGQVRSIDVAHYTGFSKPSISRAVGLLRDNGYVSIDQNGLLGLTESGMQIATSIYERHTVLTAFLTALGVDAETAAEDACRIEHVLSEETFDKLKQHAKAYIDAQVIMGVSNPNPPPLCGLHICNFFRRKCYHGYQKAVGTGRSCG